MTHTPVLLDEVLKGFDPKPGKKFIDATINGGGHGLAILEKIQLNGKLLGVEWDAQLLKQLELKVQGRNFKGELVLVNDSYVNLKKIAEENSFVGADGILFDLGMSSWHVDQSGRGFSFQKDELLDMRFSSDTEISALEIVNTWSKKELTKIFSEYGEEKFAEKISEGIAEARKEKAITTTKKLVEIIKKSTPAWYGQKKINPATKTFQALRVAVNDELANILMGLNSALEILKIGGLLAVISFHGLEDKIIKQKFKGYQKEGLAEILTKKPVKPQFNEIKENSLARSAKLRICRKI